MLFLLLGLGILATSAASWARLLSDPDFSDTILQADLLSFWWNSLMVLLQQPEFLISAPSIAVPLLVAALGPFVGLPLAVMGGLALWRKPKEIKVRGRARGRARAEAFRVPGPAAERRPVFGEGERRRAEPVRPGPVLREERIAEKEISPSVSSKPAVGGVGRKVAGLGAALVSAAAALGDVVSGLADWVRREASSAAERRAERRTAAMAAREVAGRTASAAPVPVAQEDGISEDGQPLPERIMSWYAAWMTVRAGQRPPRMLEDARRLAAELDADARSAMTGFGMRGATALSMLESAAAAAGEMRRAEEEDGFPPSPRADATSASDPDVDEFLREVEVPEAYRGVPLEGAQETREESGPVIIEDDIAPPGPSTPVVSYPSETSGPMMIEDDIGVPSVDRGSSNMAKEMAAHRLMGGCGREEIEIPLEESEFLPAPGTIEPSGVGGGVGVITTATTGWDEVEVSAPATDVSYPEGMPASQAPIAEAEVEAFLSTAGGTSVPVQTAIEPANSAEVEEFLAAAGDVGPGTEPSGEAAEPVGVELPVLPEEAVEQSWPSLPVAAEQAGSAEAGAQAMEGADLAEDSGWPTFGRPSAAQKGKAKVAPEVEMALAPLEPVASGAEAMSEEDGWPAVPSVAEPVGMPKAEVQEAGMEAPVEEPSPVEQESSEPSRPEEVVPASAVLEAASGLETEVAPEPAGGDDMPEAFPSGVAPEAQEAVIRQMLSDQRRRATILGEREGTPAWTLRRLELHGLLGLSDKSNAAVVRMWEALDRLVAHQARVFAWESLKETPPPAFATPEQRVAHVVDLAREVVAERARVEPGLLAELRSLKAGTEHVAWMDDRVDSLLAAMTSPKVVEQLGDFLPKPEEGKAKAGGRLLKVMTGRKESEVSAIVETPYEDLLAASHDIHQRYKEICKGLMVPLYRSLSVKVKEKDGRPAYAQVELVMGDVASTKQRSAAQEGAVGIIFALVPSGRWQVAEAAGRAGQDRLVLEGVGENAGRLLRVRDRSLDIFRRWVEGRNMRSFGVVHLLCEEGAVVDGIDRRWGDVEFVRNPWGQKDLEAIQKSRLRPKAG